MKLADLLIMTDSKIELWATSDGKWGAAIKGAETGGDGMLRSASGWGSSVNDALSALAQEFAGKTMLLGVWTSKRREFQIPKGLTL